MCQDALGAPAQDRRQQHVSVGDELHTVSSATIRNPIALPVQSGLSALLFLLRAALVVDSLPFRQNALVQDAGNQNAPCVLAIKHNMPAALHPAEAWANIVTLPAQRGIIGKHLATGLEIVEVTDGLVFTPCAERIRSDAEQVGFGPTRETKCGHGLAWL